VKVCRPPHEPFVLNDENHGGRRGSCVLASLLRLNGIPSWCPPFPNSGGKGHAGAPPAVPLAGGLQSTPFTARPETLGSVYVLDPHPLRSKGYSIPVDNHDAPGIL
jgi:hypothetical protein